MSAMDERRLQHRLWLRGKAERTPAVAKDVCRCENCGCAGNNECGLDYIDSKDGCALDDWLHCPCCRVEPIAASDAEYDASVGQCDMFGGAA